jgi:hypothetical protein
VDSTGVTGVITLSVSLFSNGSIELDVYISEGPEKKNRWGVNESQSKFITGTWPIFQNQPDTPLF